MSMHDAHEQMKQLFAANVELTQNSAVHIYNKYDITRTPLLTVGKI